MVAFLAHSYLLMRSVLAATPVLLNLGHHLPPRQESPAHLIPRDRVPVGPGHPRQPLLPDGWPPGTRMALARPVRLLARRVGVLPRHSLRVPHPLNPPGSMGRRTRRQTRRLARPGPRKAWKDTRCRPRPDSPGTPMPVWPSLQVPPRPPRAGPDPVPAHGNDCAGNDPPGQNGGQGREQGG